MTQRPKKILLIGWDGADWKAIHPLMDAGKMPALNRFVNQGVMGNIATLHPPLSPMLWTTIATGKRPFKHGVLGFTEPAGDRGVRPVSGLTRKTRALWNIFTLKGMKSNVVGWWPSHPAEPINGAMVSDHFHRANAPLDKPWPVQPGAVHPARLTKDLAELRFHPQELGGSDIKHFIPDAEDIDQEKDRRLYSVAKIIAEAATIHAAATHLMATEPWDFMGVYYDAIDHFSHGFMRYNPPKQDHVSQADYDMFHRVVEAGYRFHDMMLHTLVKAAGDDAVVILVSDHGFHPDHLRPRAIPREPAGLAVEHSDFGIIAMKGPVVRKDEHIFGASLLDVTPTILTLFGLPVGDDMDGRVLTDAFETPPAVQTIPSWDAVEGAAGEHPHEALEDPFESQAALDQLVALGYIEKPDENKENAIAKTLQELRYNKARAYMDAGLYDEALPLMEELYAADPDEYRFGVQLALCYRTLDYIEDLKTLADDLGKRRQKDAIAARKKLREMREMIRERQKERAAGAEKKAADPPGAGTEKQDDAMIVPPEPLLNEKEQAEMRDLTAMARLDPAALDYLKAFAEMAGGTSWRPWRICRNPAKPRGSGPACTSRSARPI